MLKQNRSMIPLEKHCPPRRKQHEEEPPVAEDVQKGGRGAERRQKAAEG